MKRILLIALLVLMPLVLSAASVTVSWNANTESDMASYKLYQGTALIATVTHPTTTHDVLSLIDGTYTFYLSAVDTSGNESAKSDGATIIINTTPPAKPTGLKAIIKN